MQRNLPIRSMSMNPAIFPFFHPANRIGYGRFLDFSGLLSEKKSVLFTDFAGSADLVEKIFVRFLSEAFTTYGLPTSLFTNRRSFYAEIYKTLQELNIEVSFVREEKQMESVFWMCWTIPIQIFRKKILRRRKKRFNISLNRIVGLSNKCYRECK